MKHHLLPSQNASEIKKQNVILSSSAPAGVKTVCRLFPLGRFAAGIQRKAAFDTLRFSSVPMNLF